MEKIDLTVRYTRRGEIIPLRFEGEAISVQIRETGRRWETEQGRHLLVMDFQNQTYHLFHHREEDSWYLVQDLKPPGRPA